jgi:hypothetical protein
MRLYHYVPCPLVFFAAVMSSFPFSLTLTTATDSGTTRFRKFCQLCEAHRYGSHRRGGRGAVVLVL